MQQGNSFDGRSQQHVCLQLARLADRLCRQFALQLGLHVATRHTFGAENNNNGFGRNQQLRGRRGFRLFGIRVDIDK